MRESSESDDRSDSAIVKNAITVLVCLVVFTVAVSAPVLAVTSADGPSRDGDATASAADLSCVAEDEDVSGNLRTIAEETMAALPASVRDRAADERILISVEGSTFFSAIVNEGKEVTSVREGKIDDPTIRVQTDCATIDRIVSSDSPSTALERSISRGDIVWEGVGTARDAALSYGSKAVQMNHIVSSSESGTVQDGVDGFRKGLVFG
jgi:hypothetical protein